MSIRTTVTLDEDVLERLKEESRARRSSFRQTLNDLLRTALLRPLNQLSDRKFKVKPFKIGLRPDLNYDCTAALLDYLDGPEHK
ncbi:MAG: CopG family transcriptional regulator [Bryobacteraceae bacterium]